MKKIGYDLYSFKTASYEHQAQLEPDPRVEVEDNK